MPETDDWGGVAVATAPERDDFGGVAVAAVPEKDDWGGIAVAITPKVDTAQFNAEPQQQREAHAGAGFRELIGGFNMSPAEVSRLGADYSQSPVTRLANQEVVAPEEIGGLMMKSPVEGVLPRPEGDAYAGVRKAEESIEGLVSPFNLTLGAILPGAPAIAQKAIGAYFAGTMGREALEKVPEVAVALRNHDYTKAGEGLTEAGLSGLFATAAAAHTFGRPGTGGFDKTALREAGMPQEEIDRTITNRGQRELAPETPYAREPGRTVGADIVDGLTTARQRLLSGFADAPPAEQRARQTQLDEIEGQLLQIPREQVNASAARIAARVEPPAPIAPRATEAAQEIPQAQPATPIKEVAPLAQTAATEKLSTPPSAETQKGSAAQPGLTAETPLAPAEGTPKRLFNWGEQRPDTLVPGRKDYDNGPSGSWWFSNKEEGRSYGPNLHEADVTLRNPAIEEKTPVSQRLLEDMRAAMKEATGSDALPFDLQHRIEQGNPVTMTDLLSFTGRQYAEAIAKGGKLNNRAVRAAFTRVMEDHGFDGMVLKDGTQIVAFRPEYISNLKTTEAGGGAPRKFSVTRTAKDDFGGESTPVASFVMANGKLLSKSGAAKAEKLERMSDLFDDKPNLSDPTHNKIYAPNGETPDNMAQALYDHGLTSSPDVGAMWQALGKESQSAKNAGVAESSQRQAQGASKAQDKAFDKAAQDTTKPAVSVNELREGDTVKVGTEILKVKSVDEDHNVILEDGKKYGVQEVKEDEIIYGEHERGPEAQDQFPAKETALPKLGHSEKGTGDLFSKTSDQPFNLMGEKGVDMQRISDEKAAQEKSAAEAKALQDKQQTTLFEGRSPLDQLRQLEADSQTVPETFKPEDIEAHISKLPETNGNIIRDVLLKGKAVEEAASDNGISTAKAQEMVAKSKAYLAAAKHISPLAGRSYVDEPTSEPRLDSPEIEAVKDWTSATQESEAAAQKMKRGAGESGAVAIPKFANRKMSELDWATTNRSAKLQKSFDEAQRAQKEINRVVPSQKRQAAISVWMEANGDALLLQGWEAGAKQKWFRDATKLARNLILKEIDIAQKVRAAFDVLKQRGIKFDVLNNGRDEYVPHVWDLNKSVSRGFFGGGKLQEKFRFSKARTLDTFADGDAAGFTPKTLAIGKLLPAYLQEMNKVIADRQFVQDLSNGKAGDVRPLIVPRGRVSAIDTDASGKAYLANPDAIKGMKDKYGNPVDTSDYQVLNHPALHDWRWEGKDENGNPIFMRDDLAVHPDVARRIKSILGKSAIREWYNSPSSGFNPAKMVVQGTDVLQSVMKREMFGLLAPFHQVQEGTHGIAHRVDPIFGIEPVDMRKPKFMDAARHGLMLLPDRTSSASYMEGLGAKGTFLTQALRWFGEKNEGIAGRAATSLANVIDGYQDYLFHRYIPSLKFKTYEAIVKRNMKVYGKELRAGTMTPADVKLTSAEQANAAYGHLNLALLDRDPTMQHLLQVGLLAPDFLEARSRFVGQAGKGLLGSKVGEEQFKALAFIALVQAGSAYALSKLSGNNYDPKKPFSVVTKDREYTLRSVPEDLLRFGTDVSGIAKGGNAGIPFISARINPMAQSALQYLTGRNYRGEKTGWKDTTEELLAKYIPITARSLPGIRQLTETSRQSPISPLEQLAGSMGLKISRHSPISDTYVKAADWMKKQGMKEDRGNYPVSKYQQLRYALEDGDMDKAKEEYAKLIKEAPTGKIAAGFRTSVNHPFTKSTAMDAQFGTSLNPSDKAVYELAKRKRQEILSRFSGL